MAKKEKKKAKPKKKKEDKTPKPEKTATEHLKEKSNQSGPDAMAATPTTMPDQALTSAAVYSTGPGEVVAYDYQRTGTYADDYNQQQAVDVQGQSLTGPGQGG